MAEGLLIGMSEADLLDYRASVLAALKQDANRVLVSANSGAVSATKDFWLPPMVCLREINYALSKFGHNVKVTRTSWKL